MSKAWAKIVVLKDANYGFWHVELQSDLGYPRLDRVYPTQKKEAIALANEWSRRLRGIPVEVEE
jgi:hypothetical protein